MQSDYCTAGHLSHRNESVCSHKTCTRMFITALFLIARKWKQHRCPSVGEWLNTLVHLHQECRFWRGWGGWGSKITADGDCSHEIKRSLYLGRKAMTNLDSILKSRDIPLPTKIHLVKAMVFPVVMYGCESWTIKKKAEHRRIDAFELWFGEDS